MNEFLAQKEGATLASFLGTIAFNGKFAPLDIPRWDNASFKPFKRDILTLVAVIC